MCFAARARALAGMASAAPKASATLHRALAQQPRPARRIRAHADALKACRLAGVGSSVPETALSNDDLSAFVDTSDEWIAARTGIRKRHVVAQGETITQHATASAKAAMEMAGLEGADVDMVIVATSSPDDVFGSATQVRRSLARTCTAFLRMVWHSVRVGKQTLTRVLWPGTSHYIAVAPAHSSISARPYAAARKARSHMSRNGLGTLGPNVHASSTE